MHEIVVCVAFADHLTAEQPDIVAVIAQCLGGELLFQEVKQERCKELHDALPRGNIGIIVAPALRPIGQVRTIVGEWCRLIRWNNQFLINFVAHAAHASDRLLNACRHFPGFVYAAARLAELTKTIEIDVRPRKGSRGLCADCGKPAPGYDQLLERRFEFIPLWGFAVILLYSMRRVACATCGVKVEEVPWGMGKHTLAPVIVALAFVPNIDHNNAPILV